MTHPVVDLRSDTLTRPTPGMLEAIATAEVGDDVYGEDPEVNALEAEVAQLLGHEAGLFCPTGSMSNMLGVRALVPAGQEIICDSLAHIVRAELGGHAVFGQVTTRTWQSLRGQLDADQALGMAVPDAGPYFVSTAAIAIEDTHNFGGGTVQSVDELRRLRAGAAALGLDVHLDGARLWNAHVATGVPLSEYGSFADTVSVCLSKGLGAPVGSVLVASAERIAEARIWRKRMGGGMRQVGVLAAAGRYALKHHVARLADDHARARTIAEALAGVDDSIIEPELVRSNIVASQWPSAAAAQAFIAGCAAEGLRVSAVGARVVRLVTHLDIDESGAGRAAEALPAIAKQALNV
ncbi:GntG family PLP-dependent aldolase [Kineosporia sp. NBRC 101731]|uniref:threonine aldolase family protein n=1 Tax=Kineosporia sp. NBRC 101731 TaxID=3032199 RepID=UPI0024A3153E|nr:GntG family PLP-dependent aldolase [Kineosporia sp. NBRC 101731]GLY32869.1 threonine aldolase [Kineosporia sp. NBRC 101731]